MLCRHFLIQRVVVVLLGIRYCCGGSNKKINERVLVMRDLRSVSV